MHYHHLKLVLILEQCFLGKAFVSAGWVFVGLYPAHCSEARLHMNELYNK